MQTIKQKKKKCVKIVVLNKVNKKAMNLYNHNPHPTSNIKMERKTHIQFDKFETQFYMWSLSD